MSEDCHDSNNAYEVEECMHDYDWMPMYIDSDDPLDEHLICLNCGHVK